MTQPSSVVIDFHTKRYSDFDLLRIVRAVGHGYEAPVTAYLVNVNFHSRSALGVVFGHTHPGPYGRFADGHLIRTADIQKVEKEGRFWVITTVNSRYVVVTFRRDFGRQTLRKFQRLSKNHYVPT